MCGILGIVGPRIDHFIGNKDLCSVLAHRGPSEQHTSHRKNIYLSHTRLSIIDLEGGSQPMESDDGRFSIIFNGEIYNYLELRQELKSYGYLFRTHSDTEVLLNSYRHWGKQCVNHLRGMFAFAISDFEKHKLFLARDHFGIKPLVYSYAGKHFTFASEIQALRAVPMLEEALEPNPQAIYELLRFGYASAPQSAYKQIYKLPPAHWLEINCDSPSSSVSPVRYWEMVHNPDESLSTEECVELVDSTIRESVKTHLVSDVPFGAFLSGGLDSTLVVSYMSELLDQPVHTFSIGFDEAKYDERSYAREAAQCLQTRHFEEVVSSQGLDLIPKLIQHFGEPFGDSSAVPTWFVSRLASTHVPMVLSGDGGDEFFGGYHSYNSWLTQLERENQLSASFKTMRLARRFLSRLMPVKYPPKPAVPKTPLDRWIEIIGFYKTQQIKAIMSDDFCNAIQWQPGTMQESLAIVNRAPSLTMARNIDIYNYLPNDILTKVDVASMMHGLEVRTPLIDLRVAELSGRIPWDRLIENRGDEIGWAGKLPIRSILARKFNRAFIDRTKQGFGIPVREWLFGNDKRTSETRGRLLSSEARINQWLNPLAVKNILDQELGFQTWHLLVLEEWLEQNRF